MKMKRATSEWHLEDPGRRCVYRFLAGGQIHRHGGHGEPRLPRRDGPVDGGATAVERVLHGGVVDATR